MISIELIVIFVVALIVFGPDKLPMLARDLGSLFRWINQLKQQTIVFWQSQLDEQQLRENVRKAEKADAAYKDSDQQG